MFDKNRKHNWQFACPFDDANDDDDVFVVNVNVVVIIDYSDNNNVYLFFTIFLLYFNWFFGGIKSINSFYNWLFVCFVIILSFFKCYILFGKIVDWCIFFSLLVINLSACLLSFTAKELAKFRKEEVLDMIWKFINGLEFCKMNQTDFEVLLKKKENNLMATHFERNKSNIFNHQNMRAEEVR